MIYKLIQKYARTVPLFLGIAWCIYYTPRVQCKTSLIYLISTPRSLSTVFFRMMHARGDHITISEPGTDAYTYLYEPEACDVVCDAQTPKTFSEVQKFILVVAHQDIPIFIKEMGFAARHYLFGGKLGELILQEARPVFLIRNPHAALISLYKKRPEIFSALDDWMNYEALWNMFVFLCVQSIHKPHIIIAELLSTDPQTVISNFCMATNITFDESQLHWEQLKDNALEYPWNTEAAAYWFDDVLISTGFIAATTYAVNEQGVPTFAEIENVEHRAYYQALYEKNLPYYEKFRSKCNDQFIAHK